ARPEDDDDEDPEEDPFDYPADGGDDSNDNEGSSEDDDDDDMDIEADEDEEEEHPAPANSVVVASTAADQAPSAEETRPFESDETAATPPPYPACRMTARISIPTPVPVPAWEDRPEVTLPPRKRLGIALGPGYEVGDSSSAAAAARPAGGLRADYGFVATRNREIMCDPERERLGCPERLGYDRHMRVILFVVRLCHYVLPYWGQMIEIRELHAADRRRQTVISELLRADHRRST
nr:hypothetical protein [Tanacetum cinerariifolium]